MTQTLRHPPTLRSLLEDKRYNKYFLTVVKQNKAIQRDPWLIMAVTPEEKWARTTKPTWKDALHKGLELLDNPRFRDIAIISRPRIFKTPEWAHEMLEPGEDWCGRCRRPTLFNLYARRHPALRDVPVIVENTNRCYFCGMREGMK